MTLIDELGNETDRLSDEPLAIGLLDVALDSLSLLEPHTRIGLAGRYEQRLASVRLLAGAEVGGTDSKRAKAALSDPARSSASQRRDASRATILAANTSLSDQVAAGSVSGDGVDALARAADETGTIPADLMEAAAGLPADQTGRMVANYLADNTSRQEANNRFAQQHEARRVRRYSTTTPGGVEFSGLAVEGPDAAIDRLWFALCADAEQVYQVPADPTTPAW